MHDLPAFEHRFCSDKREETPAHTHPHTHTGIAMEDTEINNNYSIRQCLSMGESLPIGNTTLTVDPYEGNMIAIAQRIQKATSQKCVFQCIDVVFSWLQV